MRRLVLIITLVGTIALGIGLWYLYRFPYFPEARFADASETVISDFTAGDEPTRAQYEALAGYFLEGFVTYATPGRARARYPGLAAGGATPVEQEMEGFARIAPLAAVWVKSRGSERLRLPSGTNLDVAELLRTAVLSGTNMSSAEYWGEIPERDQRIAEAADVALALWISRETVWASFSAEEREQIVRWLLQVNGKAIADNNWHLFVAQVNVALKALGVSHDDQAIQTHLARTMEFYRGDGWFSDGPAGPVDYYNAWGFYYHIAWIHRMDPSLLVTAMGEPFAKFSADLLHLMGPNGFPVMGRSVCYRLAATAPLVFASQYAPAAVSAGQARRALNLNWDYFLERGAARDGRITQGFCGDDPRLLDNYSGAASCLWSLRSLIVALDLPPEAPFWAAPAEPLPVEIADYERSIAGGLWTVRGIHADADIVLVNRDPLPDSQTSLEGFPVVSRLRSAVRGGGVRPGNEAAKYRRAEYGSRQPFCGCPS